MESIIKVLSIPFNGPHGPDTLHPALIQHPDGLVLIDCGYPDMLPLLTSVLQEHSLSWQQLRAVFITHHDIDHYGCVAEIKMNHPHIEIWAPKAEKPYLEGQLKSLRLQQAEDNFLSLPPDHREWAQQFMDSLRALVPVTVDRVFEPDSELLPGVRIVATPGHMPGHVSLWHQTSRTLVAADAVVLENGRLAIANPDFCLHLPAAYDSVKKLASLKAQMLICYHGGVQQDQLEILWAQLLNQAPA